MQKNRGKGEFEFVSGYREFSKLKHSKWSGRKDDNRLEPECWPMLDPSFEIRKTDKIFTIGSCFARNIESHLLRHGFDVTSTSQPIPFTNLPEMQVLNKYTPASIYQELKWANDILKRDDEVHAEDVKPLLFNKCGDEWIDMHLLNVGVNSVTFEQAFERRKIVYEVFKNAFSADVVVITLGLVESWWDTESGQYILSMPDPRWKGIEGRFLFKVQKYNQSHDYVKKSIELLTGHNADRILMTTSPVPLARTFSSEDVIVRNMYSKSVLRSVAGDICDEFPCADYFPSYESVMLTKQDYVWGDDLTHVSHGFVGKIMNHALNNYVPELFDDKSIDQDVQQFIDLVGVRDYSSAGKVYENTLKGRRVDDLFFHSCAAFFWLKKGDLDSAELHSLEFLKQFGDIQKIEQKHNYFNSAGAPVYLYNVIKVFSEIGKEREAKILEKCFYSDYGKNTYNLILVVISLENDELYEDALAFAQKSYKKFPECSDFPVKIMQLAARLGKHGLYQKAVLDLTRMIPEDVYIQNQAVHILEERGRIDAAIEHALKACELEPENIQLTIRYTRLLEKGKHFERARHVYREGLAAAGGPDLRLLHAYAIFEKTQKNFSESLALFRQLKAANFTSDGIEKNIELLAKRV